MGNIKTILVGLSLTMAVGMPAAASDELTMVVGTYTDQSTSDGMYVYRFNQRTGKSQLVGDVQAGNPSFLMMNHDANRVYAVSEYDDGRQGLGAFILNRTEGTMTPLGYQKCGTKATRPENKMPGAAPCNVMLYGGNVVTSNYNGGDISVFPIKEDGSVAPESQYFDMHREGSGVVSHIHCCQMTPDHQYMLANDLGNDCIWRFQVNDGKEFYLILFLPIRHLKERDHAILYSTQKAMWLT